MNNFDLYRLCNLIVNKDVYANAMSDSEFDLQLKAKNILLFTSKLPSEKSINSQLVGTGVSRASQHDLAPFLIDTTFSISGTGFVNTIGLYEPGLYYLEDYWTATSKTSEIISLQEVAARLASYIKPPTSTDLVAYIVEGGFKILSVTSGTVYVLGYRLPEIPIFAVTTDETTLVMTYNSGASTELEWSDGCKLDILYLILQDMGVSMERQDVTQLANKLIQAGK